MHAGSGRATIHVLVLCAVFLMFRDARPFEAATLSLSSVRGKDSQTKVKRSKHR